MVCPTCESEAKEKKMYGFHEGYSENSNIKYCPYCGEEIYISDAETVPQNARIAERPWQ